MKTSDMLLWILGTTLLAFFVGANYWGEHQRREGLASFGEMRQLGPAEWVHDGYTGAIVPASLPSVADLKPTQDRLIAVLRIPGIDLEAPVYPGTTAHLLRQGSGLFGGAAFPGGVGNMGLAAHCDAHSRGLEDVAIGDLIELDTLDRTRLYRITALEVMGPEAVRVLDDTGESMLTLVTCNPFHFFGNAPQRYVVHAMVADGSM